MPNYSTTQCQGWSNPSTTFYEPIILTLSSYYSPAGSTSLVTIYGENFYSYSTVLFATYNPTVYFISSTTLQFYVPSSLYPGDYSLQVFNGSIGSNIVTYTLDNSSGYWILNLDNTITNTNKGGINVTDQAILGSLEVINESTFNNNATFNESITVSNTANFGNKIEVVNDATFNTNLILSGTSSTNYIQFPDGSQQVTAYNSLIGEIKMYSGVTLPDGYLWCDGGSYFIDDHRYVKLFNVIGYTYGSNSGTFAVPNLQARFPIGSAVTKNMGVTYFNEYGHYENVITKGNQQMKQTQLGQHTHSFVPTGGVTLSPDKFLEGITLATNDSAVDAGNTDGSPHFLRSVNNNQGPTKITVTNNMSGNVGSNNYAYGWQEDFYPPFTVVNYIICYQ